MHRPYGVFDDLGVFVGRAYMPADQVSASSTVRSVGTASGIERCGTVMTVPYGAVGADPLDGCIFN